MTEPPRPLEGARWFDSHCHLQDEADVAGTLAEARAAGVERVVCVGTDFEQSVIARDIAASFGPDVYATVGLHPHDAKDGLQPVVKLAEDSAGGQVVAVGECGLDYHYDRSPRELQRSSFAAQVSLAKSLDLTLVVHTREAWADTFDILEEEEGPERTIFHCFTGGPAEARRCLEMGSYLSFSGIVTFPRATDVRESAALCPLDRLLVETDAPFLAPVPYRGKRNRPAWVPRVGAAVAELKGLGAEEVAASSWRAACAAFRLDRERT